MSFSTLFNRVFTDRLSSSYGYSSVILVIGGGLIVLSIWAMVFRIDQVARASGEVIASSRVQVIQSVDGGVISELLVREGDRVQKGQVIAQLDQVRIGAAVKEIEARLSALKAKAIRLRAEVTESDQLIFPDDVKAYPEQVTVETALFNQRRAGYIEEQKIFAQAVNIAKEEVGLISHLTRAGDANRTEMIRAKRTLNDAEAKLADHRNRYFEQARIELTKTEDEIAQNEQILTQRRQQLEDSVFVASRAGIVKNISVTTVGGVLRAGDELMQIVPLDDDLIMEAKVSPVDVSMVRVGQQANIRFDPFDYTIFGSVEGRVTYVSADTLKNDTAKGEEIFYRVHIAVSTNPVTTTSGNLLEILPGMTAQVDIRSGDRTLMDYLLKPLRRTLSESFGER
ncbi:HlyD family efflux transporter periplasmic adaptor subunit [Aestuariicella sp. G3-2]|uniref:HlyD family efflux transporter periplasmic adaptor subunit n=1 Tax=Pseudomaricurvus albidus TaxID=2842452 RepID=UPI001C0AE7AB|nr:HlyD family efflux transporter periplasmic adaptor subunit [Aestuariicella albida]MBU3069185.1 HlyD family efflux transporter periplasmic adaptor subunit [Aestuariicella albida]